MAHQSSNVRGNWLESDEEIWGRFRKWEQRKRDFYWLVFSLFLMVLGSLTGFPARIFHLTVR